jgi:dihydroorotase
MISDVRLPDGRTTDVLIRAGHIAEIAERIPASGCPTLAGRGRLLLPAGIDFHVHFRTPGATHKETLFSGARAAVKGGTATCGDMPNTQPPTTTWARLEEKVALTADLPAQVYCHFGAEPDNFAEVRRAAGHPRCKALKIFMGPSTGHGGLAPDAVAAHFRNAADAGLPGIVHAEDVDLIHAAAPRFPHDARHHGDLRPLAAELSAVRLALELAKRYPVRLCIAHTTSARVIELAEASGIRERIFIEAAPHHVLLASEGIVPPDDCRFKVNPPLRPEAERAALAARLAEGIDGLGSDHAPHTLAEKRQPYDDAPSGIPGVEYQFPLAISWWREGRISLPRLIELTSGAAARFFGLNKGRLAVGAEADLILVDPDAVSSVGRGEDRVASRCGYSLFEGMTLRGRVELTLVAGRVAWSREGGWTDAVPARWDGPGGAGGAGDSAGSIGSAGAGGASGASGSSGQSGTLLSAPSAGRCCD